MPDDILSPADQRAEAERLLAHHRHQAEIHRGNHATAKDLAKQHTDAAKAHLASAKAADKAVEEHQAALDALKTAKDA